MRERGSATAEGELTEVFNNTGAPQPTQWTSVIYTNGPAFAVTELREDESRQLFVGGAVDTGPFQYRCVATPTN